MNPDDRLYTNDHEWLKVDGETGTVGVTDYAQRQLGEVVYVELPKVGDTVTAGTLFGTIESVKAVSELFAPASGEVIQANDELANAPEKVNKDPYGEGWMIRIRITTKAANLMSASQYDEYVK